MISYFWDSASHLEIFSLGFESVAGIVELILAVCFGIAVFALRNEPTEATKKRKERLEAALGMVAAIFFIFAVVACWRILLLSGREKVESERQFGTMSKLLDSATNDLAVAKNASKATQIQLANAELSLSKIKNAIPPRQINEKQRELFISLLISSNNVSPKIPIKVLVGDANKEADDFAKFIRQMLNDAGYGTNGEQIVRISSLNVQPIENANGSRMPPIFMINATDNAGNIIPMSLTNFGSIAWFKPTAITIPVEIGNPNLPTAYRYTTNPNDIIYGISDILGYIGFQPERLNAPGILKPGEVGFYISSQTE